MHFFYKRTNFYFNVKMPCLLLLLLQPILIINIYIALFKCSNLTYLFDCCTCIINRQIKSEQHFQQLFLEFFKLRVSGFRTYKYCKKYVREVSVPTFFYWMKRSLPVLHLDVFHIEPSLILYYIHFQLL